MTHMTHQPGLYSLLLASCLAMAASNLVQAQPGERLTDCMTIENPDRRLACYDNIIGRPDTPAAPPPAETRVGQENSPDSGDIDGKVANNREEAAPPSVENFGRPRVQPGADDDFELIDTVVDIQQHSRDKIEVTLSSGQIWRQTAAERFHLTVGEEVRIYPSDFGTDFRLSPQARAGFIQVRRIDD